MERKESLSFKRILNFTVSLPVKDFKCFVFPNGDCLSVKKRKGSTKCLFQVGDNVYSCTCKDLEV